MIPQDENFQILEHQSPLSNWPTSFFWNFEQFLYIKHELFKLYIVKNSKN